MDPLGFATVFTRCESLKLHVFFRFLGFRSNLLESKRFQFLEAYTDPVFGYLYDMQMNFEEFFT